MDPFTIAGLASTGIGAIGKLFGGSDEDERRGRFNEYLALVRSLKQEAQRRALRQTGGMIQQATTGAARRAAASGRTGDLEAYVLPSQANAVRAAGRVVQEATQPYDASVIHGAQDFYNRPISRGGIFDLATELGGVATQYGLGREGIQAQQEDIAPGTMYRTPSINPDVEAEIGSIRKRRKSLYSTGG
jgi:hypothetical protein